MTSDKEFTLTDQIVKELERQILTGELKDGTVLMSVAGFSMFNGVNPRAVTKAYRRLKAMGFIKPVVGLGLIVKRPNKKRVVERKNDILKAKLKECLDLAHTLKISDVNFLQVVSQALEDEKQLPLVTGEVTEKKDSAN